jgi:hypothetical protein
MLCWRRWRRRSDDGRIALAAAKDATEFIATRSATALGLELSAIRRYGHVDFLEIAERVLQRSATRAVASHGESCTAAGDPARRRPGGR